MRRALLLIGGALALATPGILRAEDAPQPLYYQHPDGGPVYAAVPTKTADGRDFIPVFPDAPAAPAAAKPSDAADRRILYYRNPMGLADTSPKPKKDSMGMDYVPVYADDGAPGEPPGAVRISPGREQILGVRTEVASLRPAAARAIRASGVTRFDERRLATVTAKSSGWIERLNVAATGTPVRRGQTLAELYSPDMVTSEAEYLVATSMGGAMADAAHNRLRALDIPETEITRLNRTGQAARRIAIMAPADGIVIDKPAQEGMRVEAGAPLYKTAGLADIWLIAQVAERDLAMIQPGAKARADFAAFPGRSFDGAVDIIYPAVSAETRAAAVRIVLPNSDGALRAEMSASVEIDAPAGGAPVVAVPDSAVLDTGQRQTILVALGQGRFEPRAVRLGPHGEDWVQVLEGVKPGERVVIDANFLVDAESNLRAALRAFTDGADAQGGGR